MTLVNVKQSPMPPDGDLPAAAGCDSGSSAERLHAYMPVQPR
jgi:hypothetical protein